MARSGVVILPADEARRRLIEAERRWVESDPPDFDVREDRDDAVIVAFRSGVGREEIAEIVGDFGSGKPVGGLLRSVDAIRRSGLTPREFFDAFQDRQIDVRRLPSGRAAFRVDDVDRLRSAR